MELCQRTLEGSLKGPTLAEVGALGRIVAAVD